MACRNHVTYGILKEDRAAAMEECPIDMETPGRLARCNEVITLADDDDVPILNRSGSPSK